MDRYLIATASGRALAQSARNAGYSVDVFDHFGDWDLQKSVMESTELSAVTDDHSVFCSRDFGDLFRFVNLTKYCAAIIGGGLESKSELVQRLEQQIRILGCPSFQLSRLGSHACLEVIGDLAESAGAKWPTTLTTAPHDFGRSSWLLKSLRGSGGNHVHRFPIEGPLDEAALVKQGSIFQKLIQGTSISALYAAQGKVRNRLECNIRNLPTESQCHLIGCSLQMVGVPDLGAKPFAYCGSIAPLELPDKQRQVIKRLGNLISSEFEIDGIFGLDLIVNEAAVWLIDINPRIPASAELYEGLATISAQRPFSVFKTHVDACLGKCAMQFPEMPLNNHWVAKGILFCRLENGLVIDETIFNQLRQLYFEDLSSTFRTIADLPNMGTEISNGEPVLTLFVKSKSAQTTHQELLQFAGQLNAILANQKL